MIREKFDENETDFDFFRFRAPRKEFSKHIKILIKKKFRVALGRFFRKYNKGEQDIPRALRLIKEFQAQRAKKNDEINRMRAAQAVSLMYGGNVEYQKVQQMQKFTAQGQQQGRPELLNQKLNDDARERSQLLGQSISLAEDNLKKQNQMLINMIEDFNDKYSFLQDKFSALQQEMKEDEGMGQLDSSLDISDDTLLNKSNPPNQA
mmetsp:Transcript_14629/g.14256  ORF Transcript_14629/g.14256 Transcript_14629/m.14256 type:complete len:206 (+) Transcript_14629:1477-2094(+)